MKTIEIYPNTFVGIDVIFELVLLILFFFLMHKVNQSIDNFNIKNTSVYLLIMWILITTYLIIFKPK